MYRKFLACALILSGASAGAQPTQPSANEDEAIVVTGTRDGSRILSVDFEKVARECAECKRVLAEIGDLQPRYTMKKNQIARDKITTTESIAAHTVGSGDRRGPKIPDGADFLNPYSRNPEQSQSGRLGAQVPHHYDKDQTELAVMRRNVSRQVASFLAQLEPHVVKAAEAERMKRKASGVIKANRSAKKEKTVDVTQAIISRLNAMQFTITLPTADLPAPTQKP